MNAMIDHIASGRAFFSGAALIVLAAISAFRPGGRWGAIGRTVAAIAGSILVAVSSTPLPPWFYAVAGIMSFAWVVVEGASRPCWHRAKRRLRPAVMAAWGMGVAMEAPYHLMPDVPRLGKPTLAIEGDSLGAGMGGEAETWPRMLASRRGIVVQDLSKMGATVSSAMNQAGRVADPAALVLAEIGGNDVLGDTSSEAYERGLDALLSRLRPGGRTVIMLELPLPPFSNAFGEIQRRLARRHGVRLVPKRVLIGVLTTRGATVDSIHLTPKGHALMAGTIWDILKPAFGPKAEP